MITESNQFFNPEAYDVEVLGFVEELIAEMPGRSYGYQCLGTRPLPGLPDRPIGSPGKIQIILTEPISLTSGYKTNLVRASKKRPVKCSAMIQPICGRLRKPS